MGTTRRQLRQPEDNTTYLLGRAASHLDDQITAGVVAVHAIRSAHSAVFIHMDLDGIRLTDLAAKAGMSPQAMGELVDELVERGYLVRQPDPTDRRAKLIVLTDAGYDALQTGLDNVASVERRLQQLLGRRRLLDLRAALRTITTNT